MTDNTTGVERRDQTPEEREATYALMRAGSSCPPRWECDAFDRYQAEVMEPLREALREAVHAANRAARTTKRVES